MSDKLKILIIGAAGGREHAIAWKLAQSPRTGEMFFARGNAGTAALGTNLDIKETELDKLIEFAKNEKVDLVLVLSDDPLALGAVDQFKEQGLRVWGPNKAAAEIEWSKAFSKNFMARHGLPTAKFKTFTDYEEAKKYLSEQNLPIVIKASGLALGKGVIIAQTREEAGKALEDMMVGKAFGEAGGEVVIEEFLTGPEISIHALSDGKNYKMFPPSQDHKKIGEGDTGPNTGGVGTIGPLPFVSAELMKEIEEMVVEPTLRGMREEGRPFVGLLYPGLILTKDGPKILEYNARFGDPETQIYMRLMENDLLEIFEACIDGTLDQVELKWQNKFASNVVVVSGGYPGEYEKGKEITGIEEAEKMLDIVVFHAGTKIDAKEIYTNGGRVLGVSAVADTLAEALAKSYKAIEKISFKGMNYRKDIGKKALAIKNV